MTTIKKPPLGIIPFKIWMEQRIKDLLDAIHRYVSEGIVNEYVCEWSTEVDALIKQHREKYGEKDAE